MAFNDRPVSTHTPEMEYEPISETGEGISEVETGNKNMMLYGLLALVLAVILYLYYTGYFTKATSPPGGTSLDE